MPRKKLDPINYCRILDLFGVVAAQQTFDDVKAGRCREATLEKYLYDKRETKERYAKKLKRELRQELFGKKRSRR